MRNHTNPGRIVQIAPATGWRALYLNGRKHTRDLDEPRLHVYHSALVGWGLTKAGDILPIGVDPDGVWNQPSVDNSTFVAVEHESDLLDDVTLQALIRDCLYRMTQREAEAERRSARRQKFEDYAAEVIAEILSKSSDGTFPRAKLTSALIKAIPVPEGDANAAKAKGELIRTVMTGSFLANRPEWELGDANGSAVLIDPKRIAS